MSATIKYKGETIATASNNTKTLLTAGKYMEANVVVTDNGGGGGATLQTKSVSYTPTESAISASVTPDPGYDGMDEVNVSVGAISSTYVGSGIARNDSTDLTASGATVTAPSGYYASNATKTIASAPTPTLNMNSVSGSGTLDVNVDFASGGYVSAGTINLTESGAFAVQAAQTITPTTTNQTIPADYYLLGAQTILGDANLVASNIVSGVTIFGITGTASGGDMSNDVKDALLLLAEKVAYIDEEGQQAYEALLEALYPIQSISAVYTQSGTVYPTDSLDSLRDDLVVTATLEDSSTIIVTGYELSGTLTVGTSTITVSFGGKTDTFSVVVTQPSTYVYYDYLYNTRPGTNEYADYVDTGLTFNPAVVAYNIEFEAMNSNSSTKAAKLMGQGGNFTTSNSHTVWYARASKAGFSTYTFKQAKQVATTGTGDTRCVIKYFYGGSSVSYIDYNNTITNVATVAKENISSTSQTFVLCGGYNSNTTTKMGMLQNVKLGYVKISDPDSGTLLYHFKPAYDTITERYGYHEVVNDVFYPANSTYLSAGNWS